MRLNEIHENLKKSTTKRSIGIIALAALVLTAAFFMKIPNAIRTGTYHIFRETFKYKAVWTTRNFEAVSGDNFMVRYTPGYEQDAHLVLDTAEYFYKPIAEKYGFSHKFKIPVIVYPSRLELNRNFGWPANESAMGVYWTGVIRVLTPGLWVVAEDSREYRDTFMGSGPMAHEFAHLVVDYITGGNYTRWFTEGIAQYEEYLLTGFEFDDPGANLDQPLYRLDQMDLYFDNLPNQGLAYRQSLLAVRYIVEVHGEDKLKAILASLGQGNKMERALTLELGLDMKNFELNYQQWAKGQSTNNIYPN